MPEDAEVERVFDQVSRLAENTQNYLVIVELPDGRTVWKRSNRDWGIGAARRMILETEEMIRMEVRDG